MKRTHPIYRNMRRRPAPPLPPASGHLMAMLSFSRCGKTLLLFIIYLRNKLNTFALFISTLELSLSSMDKCVLTGVEACLPSILSLMSGSLVATDHRGEEGGWAGILGQRKPGGCQVRGGWAGLLLHPVCMKIKIRETSP